MITYFIFSYFLIFLFSIGVLPVLFKLETEIRGRWLVFSLFWPIVLPYALCYRVIKDVIIGIKKNGW